MRIRTNIIFNLFLLLISCLLTATNSVYASAAPSSTNTPQNSSQNSSQTSVKSISLDDENLLYRGRVSDSKKFSLTGSGLSFSISGGSIWASFTIDNKAKAALNIVINGDDKTLILRPGSHRYLIADELPQGSHKINILKRNEAGKGSVQLTKLEINSSHHLMHTQRQQHRLLAIGDSITCGYGNEATHNDEGNTVSNQNGYQTYSAIAARALQSDLMIVCWSGRGISRNRSLKNDDVGLLPQLYQYILPNEAQQNWQPGDFVADHILINLGTNDNANSKTKGKLNKDLYLNAYQSFINTLRNDHPDAHLIFAIGPMNAGEISHWLPELVEKNENSSTLIFTPFTDNSEIGGHYHPHVSKHIKMSEQLSEHINSL